MIMLIKFIFFKAYTFCVNVFKEKEFPYAFASGVTTLCIVTSIVILLEIFEYAMLPQPVNIFDNYHGYFALVLWILTIVYVRRDKRYLKILDDCRNLPLAKQKALFIIGAAYMVSLFIGFFLLGYLIRDYNIHH
jgi:hypothetical protein